MTRVYEHKWIPNVENERFTADFPPVTVIVFSAKNVFLITLGNNRLTMYGGALSAKTRKFLRSKRAVRPNVSIVTFNDDVEPQ